MGPQQVVLVSGAAAQAARKPLALQACRRWPVPVVAMLVLLGAVAAFAISEQAEHQEARAADHRAGQ